MRVGAKLSCCGVGRLLNLLVIAAIALCMARPVLAADAAGAALWPAPGATNVCPDTQLRITFAAPPALSGSGKIQIIDTAASQAVETIDTSAKTATQTIGGVEGFNYYPVEVSGNQLVIHPHDGALSYGKTYVVKMDSTVLGDSADAAAKADLDHWQFSTKSSPPAAESTKLVVAADGSGDFCTVQGAIDFVPDGNTIPRTITIRKGTYTELICFGNKHSLTLHGDDRAGSVIQYANNNRFNSSSAGHIYHRGVLLANRCNDLVLENLTIRDTTPQGGSQAEAIILNGTPTSRAIVRDVDLYSYQDTLQINGQAYISNCYIEGDVDFMWGNGPSFFENCHCKVLRSKAFYTQIRNTAKNHGYVYYHCTFDGAPGMKDVYLSRIAPARFPNSEVVLLDCTLTDAVNPVGWLLNAPKTQSAADVAKDAAQVHFWEYNSHGPDGTPVDVSQRLSISRQLTQPADAEIIRNYSDPTFVLGDGWNPRASTASTTQPTP